MWSCNCRKCSVFISSSLTLCSAYSRCHVGNFSCAGFAAEERCDLSVNNENALKKTKCKCKGEIRSFIIWKTHPDSDRMLIPGVNGVLLSDKGCLCFASCCQRLASSTWDGQQWKRPQNSTGCICPQQSCSGSFLGCQLHWPPSVLDQFPTQMFPLATHTHTHTHTHPGK